MAPCSDVRAALRARVRPRPSRRSLLSLPDDALLRIFHLLLNSSALDASSFSLLPRVLPLATSCSRLHELFFSSIRVLDLATISYPCFTHFHSSACTSCASRISISALFVLIRRASSHLHVIRLPPLPLDETASAINYISQYCPRLEQLLFSDAGAVILPPAYCLLSLPCLTHLTILDPSQIFLSALVAQSPQLTHLALVSIHPCDAPILISVLRSVSSSLQALTLSFLDATPAASVVPPSVAHVLSFIVEQIASFAMPSLRHLDVATALPADIPRCFTYVQHPAMTYRSRSQNSSPILHNGSRLHNSESEDSDTSSMKAVPTALVLSPRSSQRTRSPPRLVLRTSRKRLASSASLLERLLIHPHTHAIIDVDDICVDITRSNSTQSHLERLHLISSAVLPHRVLHARLDILVDHMSELFVNSDLSRLHTLDIVEGEPPGLGITLYRQRRRVQQICDSIGSRLTAVRLLGYPGLSSALTSCASTITALFSSSKNIRVLDVTASFVASSLRRGDLLRIFESLPHVTVLRIITAHRWRDVAAATDPVTVGTEATQVIGEVLRVLPALLSTVSAAWKGLERMESHCFVAAEDVRMSEGMGDLLAEARRSIEGMRRSEAHFDASSLQAQLRVWDEVFDRTRRAAIGA